MLLGLLLCADLVFIGAHLLFEVTESFSCPKCSLATDRGYPEIFQYLKEYWIILLFGLLFWRRRAFLNVAWLLVFAYLLIDDALLVHETFGVHVAEMLSIEPMLGLRSNDLGELLVTAVVAVPLLGGIGVGYVRSGHRERAFSRLLFATLPALAFFGVVGDLIHVMLSRTPLSVLAEIVEDGGEMLVMSVMLGLVFQHALKSGSAERAGSRRCRILYVQKPDGGGSMMSLYQLVRALDRSRYEPVLIFHSMGPHIDDFRRLGASVHVINGRPSKLLPLRLARWMRREGVDLVHHNNNPHANRDSIFAAWLAGVPQVCHVRFLRAYDRIDRIVTRSVDAFVYVSGAVESQCRAALPIPEGKGRVLHNPAEVRRQTVEKAKRVRVELGLDGRPIVTVVGRLVPWKGQDVFIRAMAQVVERYPEARGLVVGGPGSGAVGQAFARELEGIADGLGLSDRVVFTGFRQDVAAIMAASDVIVHSSSRPEPFGRVIVEAMAVGRPIVATAAGGVPEIVDDGESGLLVPPGDSAAMARAIETVLSDLERARRMGERGREKVRRLFDPEAHARSIEGIYERTLQDTFRSSRG